MNQSDQLRAGDWVEVRSKEEILATLGGDGRLDALPFMPEMFQHCGRRFQVVKRAHKTCDPPNGMEGRRMPHAVHLDGVRCGGEHHGGCQAGCLIFWKDAWLKRVDTPTAPTTAPSICREQDVFAAVYRKESTPAEAVYACQSTEVHAATSALPWWDVRQYVEDVTSGNVRIRQLLAAALFLAYHTLVQSGVGLGSALRSAYDVIQKIRGGTPYPWRVGLIPPGARTPSAKLDLQAGESVRVRSFREILPTLDGDSKNRGMYFDAEHVPFCGGTYDVLARVDKLIDERTGKMIQLKNDAIILDGVACGARYSKCRHFCPRAIYPYWREIWLKRAHASDC